MRFVMVVAACGLMLGGCKTAAEERSLIWEQATLICQVDKSPAGVANFEACRLRTSRQLLEAQIDEGRARRNAISDAGVAVGLSLMAPNPPARRPLTCTSNTFAGTTTTNCY